MISSSTSLPKKRRPRLGYLILVITFVLATAFLGALFYLGTLSQRVENSYKLGLGHFTKGVDLVKKSAELTGGLREISPENVRKQTSRKIVKLLTGANKEFKLASADFKRMRRIATFEWEKETARLMIESTSEIETNTKDMTLVIKKSEKMSDILFKVNEGATKFQQAVSQSNSLISLNNNGRYAEVKSAAPQLAAVYIEAKNLITDADKVDPDARLSSYLTQIAMGEQLASNLGKMADEGLNKRPAEYNRLSEESNNLINQVIKVSQSKLMADPNNWIKDQLEHLTDQIRSREKKAEKLKKKALDLWSENT